MVQNSDLLSLLDKGADEVAIIGSLISVKCNNDKLLPSGYIKASYLGLLYLSRILLPSASSRYSIGRLSFTQLWTSVIGIPISL